MSVDANWAAPNLLPGAAENRVSFKTWGCYKAHKGGEEALLQQRGPAESPIDHQRYSIVHTVCLGVGVAGERREAQTQEKLFIFDFPQSIIGVLV